MWDKGAIRTQIIHYENWSRHKPQIIPVMLYVILVTLPTCKNKTIVFDFYSFFYYIASPAVSWPKIYPRMIELILRKIALTVIWMYTADK